LSKDDQILFTKLLVNEEPGSTQQRAMNTVTGSDSGVGLSRTQTLDERCSEAVRTPTPDAGRCQLAKMPKLAQHLHLTLSAQRRLLFQETLDREFTMRRRPAVPSSNFSPGDTSHQPPKTVRTALLETRFEIRALLQNLHIGPADSLFGPEVIQTGPAVKKIRQNRRSFFKEECCERVK